MAALALLAVVALGCGADDDDAQASGDGGAATIVEDEEAGTRVVTHPLGETEVPADPQRVVALGEEFLLADLLDLGITPVASTSTVVGFSALDPAAVEGIEELSSTEPNFEQLAALEPDLIVTDVGVAELAGYERLAAVAPTVAVDDADWRQGYLDVAAVFDRTEQAEERLAAYDAAVAEAGEELGAAGRTVSVVTIYPGDSVALWVDGPANVPQVLLDLGFELVPGPDAVDAEGGRAFVSAEQLGLVEGDDVVVLQTELVEGEDAAYRSFTEQALWRAIPAVAADRVVEVDRLGYPGLGGRISLVEELRELLAR